MLLESTPENPSKIEVWHSDMTFRQHPPSVTVLKGVTIPQVGGDTLFASMTSAYDGLSEGMKRYLEPLVAVHDFRKVLKRVLLSPVVVNDWLARWQTIHPFVIKSFRPTLRPGRK